MSKDNSFDTWPSDYEVMKHQHIGQVFNETHFFDWHAEPLEEPADSFFFERRHSPLASRQVKRSPKGGILLLAFGLVGGAGFVVIVEVAPILHRLLA